MTIGIPREIKPQEARVAITPSGVSELMKQNITVLIEENAGLLSGFSNRSYQRAGAELIPNAKSLYEKSDTIIKVKEPLPDEYKWIKPQHTVFTYFHFASSRQLTEAMIQSQATCIAYETIKIGNQLPLLVPMSEVAGRLAAQQGAKYLESPQGGAGILLGGVPGTPPAKVLVLGGGTAGTEAARVAAGMGAQVTILDTNLDRLRQLNEMLPPNVVLLFSSADQIQKEITQSHLIIGTVLIPGDKAPKLITKKMLSKMKKGTVLVDVAIDQGGCFETSEPTNHKDPIRIVEGIVHYAVTNMPGAVPQTATAALTNATLPYIKQIARHGWKEACRLNPNLKGGLNLVKGQVLNKEIAHLFDKKYTPLQEILHF